MPSDSPLHFTAPLGPDSYLTQLNVEYERELFALIEHSRYHLRAFLPWLDGVRSKDDVRHMISREQQRCLNPGGVSVLIWSQDALAGYASIHDLHLPNRSAAVGYWLGSSFTGRGLAVAAARTLVQHAFSGMRLNRLEIRCHVENARSQLIASKLGFKQEGRLAEAEWLYHRYVDHFLFAITRDQWNGSTEGGKDPDN